MAQAAERSWRTVCLPLGRAGGGTVPRFLTGRGTNAWRRYPPIGAVVAGVFARHHAFLWRDGTLPPVEHPDPIRLSNLKGYEYQRGVAVNNTRALLDGF